jgi:hypothetical protein
LGKTAADPAGKILITDCTQQPNILFTETIEIFFHYISPLVDKSTLHGLNPKLEFKQCSIE